jgi:hypothetical protein
VIAIPDCRCNHSRQRSLTTAAPPLSGDEVAPFFFLSLSCIQTESAQELLKLAAEVYLRGELPLDNELLGRGDPKAGQRHVHQMCEAGLVPSIAEIPPCGSRQLPKDCSLSNFRVFGGAYDPSK